MAKNSKNTAKAAQKADNCMDSTNCSNSTNIAGEHKEEKEHGGCGCGSDKSRSKK